MTNENKDREPAGRCLHTEVTWWAGEVTAEA